MADGVPFRMSRALKATLCEKKQQFGEENTACRSARNLPRLILTRSFPFHDRSTRIGIAPRVYREWDSTSEHAWRRRTSAGGTGRWSLQGFASLVFLTDGPLALVPACWEFVTY